MSDISKLIQISSDEEIKSYMLNIDTDLIVDSIMDKKINDDDLKKVLTSMTSGESDIEKELNDINEKLKSGTMQISELKIFLEQKIKEYEDGLSQIFSLLAQKKREDLKNESIAIMYDFLANLSKNFVVALNVFNTLLTSIKNMETPAE